jgi:hypothetical protein
MRTLNVGIDIVEAGDREAYGHYERHRLLASGDAG